MSRNAVNPTGRECPYTDDELIVSKTNLKGQITYANDVFVRLSKFPMEGVIGAPHNIIRHPHMPGSIFKLLWDTIQKKQEIFAYVLNMARDGDHYWVFAHVTPTLDSNHNVIGYHSNRRKPERDAVGRVTELYKSLLLEEGRHQHRKDGIAGASAMLQEMLDRKGVAYDEFVFQV